MKLTLTLIGIASVVALFLVFLRRRRSATATASKGPRLPDEVLPTILFDFGYWLLSAFTPLFRYLHLTPNLLSLFSVPASLAAAIAVGVGHFGLGGPLLLFAFSLDAWDGALARSLGTASDAGEVIDATIDRYDDVIVMLGFLFYFRADLVPWLLASAATVGTVAISYTRAKGEAFGVDTRIGSMQRHERGVWLGVATSLSPAVAGFTEEPSSHPTYYAVVVALAAVAIGTNVTAIRRARLVVAMLRRQSALAVSTPISQTTARASRG